MLVFRIEQKTIIHMQSFIMITSLLETCVENSLSLS